MLLHMLGGGPAQLRTIRRIRERGFKAVVSDYLQDAPGKLIADITTDISTFDRDEIIRVSREKNIDGILTAGTDQPVLTAAITADVLGLPCPISPETALAATSKRFMKPLLKAAAIPTAPFVLAVPEAAEATTQANGLVGPYVIKPVDSQGQRGVVKVEAYGDLAAAARYAISFSRDSHILVESFYPSREMTASSWVLDGRPVLLALTDRITVEQLPHIGVCHAHRWPSRFHGVCRTEVIDLLAAICTSFGIKGGPLYVQFLLGDKGLLVNEIACRIGGAYEDALLPLMTGIDIIDLLIDATIGIEASAGNPVRSRQHFDCFAGYAAVLLLFASPPDPGVPIEVAPFERLAALPGVAGGEYHLRSGMVIEQPKNATQRAGYVIVTADTPDELADRCATVYRLAGITDPNGRSLIMPLPKKEFRDDA